jgi:Skp family chaperone for outer membrane proteins
LNDPEGSNLHRMNRNLVLVSALGAGLLTTAAMAQTATTPAPAPAPAATPSTASAAANRTPPAPPQAVPAKIALIAFEQAVFATNEGQKTVQDIQKKYEPKRAQIETQGKEVDSLKKQIQSAPATLSDEERATRLKNIDSKEKELNREAEDANNAYQADLQEAYGKVARKVSATVQTYVAQNGYTLLLDVSNQQNSNVMWASQNPNIDITMAVVDAYTVGTVCRSTRSAAPDFYTDRASYSKQVDAVRSVLIYGRPDGSPIDFLSLKASLRGIACFCGNAVHSS